MNGFSLFSTRILREWKFQYGVIKSVADWTILLYIILPSIAIGVGMYRSWWMEVPNWIVPIPVELVFLVGYVFTWFGNYRTFIEEADKVFLIKNKHLFLRMKIWSYFLTVITQTVSLLLLLCVLLPFLIVHFELKLENILVYFFYLLHFKILLMYGKQQLSRIKQKYIGLLFLFFVFVIGSWITQLVIWAVTNYATFLWFIVWVPGFLGMYLSINKLRRINRFDEELITEREERLRYIGLIYQFSFSIEKTTPVIRKNPLLFRHSKRLFKKRTASHAFIELFLKVFLRNFSYVLSYFQFIGVTISAMIVSPTIWLVGLFFVAFLFIIRWYLDACWEKITASHPLVGKYKEHPGYYEGKRKAVNSLFLIAVVITVVFSSTGIYYLSQVDWDF
ncbi:ABC transporter permease [Robertmurraya korlensis]|uniref:ABC transporter permease n=1 Tax=Robertmurraya korlensis TaxID=519977 RepID=UPI0008269DDD|nr:ABC transporter permease [Robertmurraya korlensis]